MIPVLIPPFDVFSVDEKGILWRSHADSLDDAKARVQEFGRFNPGDYVIVSLKPATNFL